MNVYNDLQKKISQILKHGEVVKLRYFAGSVSDTDFDDAQVLVQSGNDIYTSGIVFALNDKDISSSYNPIISEKGKLTETDKKLYIKGDVVTTDTMRIGIGSPDYIWHSVIPNGIKAQPPTGTIVYKKIYIRELPLGSLSGE